MDCSSNKSNRPENIYDLAIIGSGPAGSLAAALAAKAGLDVIIFEQKKHPRPKVCGGFLSARAISLLPGDLNLFSPQAEPVYQVSIIKKRKPYTYNSKNRLGLVIKREHLDQLLAEYAIEAGAKLKENEIVESMQTVKPDGYDRNYYLLKTAKNKITGTLASFLIIADGAHGSTLSKVGLSRKPSFCGWGLSKVFNMKSPIAETGILKFYPLPLLGGMGWSFSGPDWTNHGVGGLAGKKHLLRAYQKLFPKDFEADPGCVNPVCWALPFLGPLQNNASHSTMVIGDAAGLVEPFSGEGLYNSLKSAHLAVSATLESMAKSDSQAVAAEIFNPLFRKHFRSVFCKTLIGSTLLHARSILAPSTLPSEMAALMNNALWFNQSLDLSTIGTD